MAAYLYGALLHVEALEEREEIQERIESSRRLRRELRDAQNPFTLSDAEFIKNFRLNKDGCFYLIDTLSRRMPQNRNPVRIPNHLRILTVLDFLAVGSYQRSVGNNLFANMSQAMVSRCFKQVTNLIVRLCLRKWIKFPKNDDQRDVLKQGFLLRHRLHQIIGVVGGTHVAIVKPAADENEHIYVNRKGYHSLNVQIVCDANLQIISCFASFPGSSHDSHIWRNSVVSRVMRANFLGGDTTTRILGDSGYPCLGWLLVPLPNPNNEREVRYNNAVKRARSCVERCIGVLKGRFWCLLKDRRLHYSPVNEGRIIMACTILHNIAKHYKTPDPEPVWDEIDQEQPVMQDNFGGDILNRQIGQEYRQRYIEEFF